MSGVRIPPPRPLFSATLPRSKPWVTAHSVVAVAHQVEHRIVAPEVVGSRPISHPIFLLAFWLRLQMASRGGAVSYIGRLSTDSHLYWAFCAFAVEIDLQARNGVNEDDRLDLLLTGPVNIREAI